MSETQLAVTGFEDGRQVVNQKMLVVCRHWETQGKQILLGGLQREQSPVDTFSLVKLILFFRPSGL